LTRIKFARAGCGAPVLQSGISPFGTVTLSAIFALIIAVVPAFQLDAGTARPDTILVRNDRGGAGVERIQHIQSIRENGLSVDIGGQYCLSACTLYLGVSNVCVHPETTFGFHGPSSPIYGVGLPAESFEHWSRVMANYYPEPLRKWYMRKGRHRIVGFHEFKGRDLIRMGLRSCGGNVTTG